MWKDELRLLIKFRLPLNSLHDICFERKKRHFFKIMMPVLFRCFIHMEGYLAHIQPWPVSFKNTTYTQGFYFIVMLFFVFTWTSIKFTPLRRRLSHTCTNIFLKEYHNHCLKWVLKSFLSQGIRHPVFSRNVLLYSMNFCEKWCYASTPLSEYRVLHPF